MVLRLLLFKTRSGRAFAAWDGTRHIPPATDTFDLSSLLREAVSEHDRRSEILEGSGDLNDTGYISDHPCSPPPTSTEPASLLQPAPAHTLPAMPPNLTGEARRLMRKKLQSKKNRKLDRAETNAAGFSHHDARPKTVKKYVTGDHAVQSPTCMTEAKVARTAYIGLNDKDTRDAHTYTLDELVGEDSKFKFKLVKYKKGCVFSRTHVYLIQISLPTEYRLPS